ncbi:Rieske (2Fe-2S) protein [Brevibacillus centrosporus]|uniref:Ferredoxin subunit of nitrite reductase or a ring-hydroxylating dioxygenase n=1 Tax=Brevibacillus centrosporus TaxID=54910 RepID=A0A1I3R624_9BACL|nr:Rieske (2Fe-2S) protein [Brevibacillus centrosporus]MEC2129654.1 Rieske (2Fe-2S) protein [Brevibacillus centrosporus]GED30013.1 ferredoxin [Brevibacillus centrosporus]SFJ42053.1 Ferredoxin subunit of nitrite reductase or a ring-hydroxylating dioxygenase [Brevibacillus centrosporus]
METGRISAYKVEVCSTDQLKPSQRKLIEINGVEIAVMNVEGKLYAYRNACPHQGAPMVYGTVTGTMLPCKRGEYTYGHDQEIIRCPLHSWEFHLTTGKSLFDPCKVSIKKYEVTVEDDTVVIYFHKRPEKVSEKEVRYFV